jgi:hypothetical protein
LKRKGNPLYIFIDDEREKKGIFKINLSPLSPSPPSLSHFLGF